MPSYATVLREVARDRRRSADALRKIDMPNIPAVVASEERQASDLEHLAALLERVTEREAHFLVGVGVPMRAQGKTEIPAELERIAGILLALDTGPQPEEGRDVD